MTGVLRIINVAIYHHRYLWFKLDSKQIEGYLSLSGIARRVKGLSAED